MGFNEFLSSIFGNKSTRDMKTKSKPLTLRLKNWIMMDFVPKHKN